MDGQNVAIRHGKDHFSALGLQITAEYWQEKGHRVIILLPDYYFKEEEVEKKKETITSQHNKNKQNLENLMKKLPDDI